MPLAQKFRPPKVTGKPKQKQTQTQTQTQTQPQAQSQVQSQLATGASIRTTSSSQQQTQSRVQSQAQSQSQATHIGYDQTTSTRAMHRLVADILGSIFYMRTVIPDDNFIEAHWTVPQRVKANGSIAPAVLFPVRQFRNNYTPEASDALGWLDFGILGALNKKYLRSLIVVIYLKEETRNKAIEAYTFNFTYGDDSNVAQQMEQLQVGSQQSGRPRNMREAFETSARRMMRELWRTTGQLTELPHEVTFDFKIFYTDDTPEDYQPSAFQDDDSEIFLASHASDEVPITFDSEATASTGFHNMTCHVTSIAHWLPPKGEIEEDPTASDRQISEEQRRVAREHQREVEADEPHRDILWPLEQTIYGRMSSALVDSSQLESVTVEPTKETGFTHPVGQMLPDGTIMAIPKHQQRWSDETDDVIVMRGRPDPLARRRSFQAALAEPKPGYEAWSHATQNATQEETQTLPRDSSMQIESITQIIPGAQDQFQESNADETQDQVLDIEMDQTPDEEQEAQGPLFSAKHRSSSQSTESSDIGPETPEDEPFDPATQPRQPALPKSPIRRRRSMSVKSTTKVPKVKSKPPPTATQIYTPFKPRPKPKKRAKSIDAATGLPKVVPKRPSKGEKKRQGGSSTAVGAEAKQISKGGAIVLGPKGNKVVNRVSPQTLAAADPPNSPIDNPNEEMQIDPFPLSLDTNQDSISQSRSQDQSQSQIQSQIESQSQARSQTQSQQAQSSRHHPYRPRQVSAGPSSPQDHGQSASSSQQRLPVPQTHMTRVRSSRGIRGLDYSLMKRPLPVIAEENV